MFKEIFLFEIKYRLKRPATLLFVFYFVGILIVSIGGNELHLRKFCECLVAIATMLHN
jgi:hypothetical protein